eukprot:m.176117 g.176117  ORF g.176117 m.176117 type:complete len:455 (-) comp16795_c0_seq4:1859-3223(-)
MASASGFVCPLCYQEFESASTLEVHFNKGCNKTAGKSHAKGSRWSTFLNRGKSNVDEEFDDDVEDHTPRFVEFAAQEIGAVRTLTRKFRDKRKERKENDAIQESRLIRHLEKLIFHGPAASSKSRKDFERSVIAWADGKFVPCCPECGKKFGMTRRQHHCRLCGSLICAACSLALEADVAVTLTVPPQVSGAKRSMPRDKAIALLRKKMSIPGEALRICGFCNVTLTRKTEKQASNSKQKAIPPVIPMFQEIETVKKAIEEALPLYNHDVHRMCELGDLTMYSKISSERDAINKNLHRVSVYSKKLAGLLGDKAQKFPSSHRLHTAIARSWKEFVQLHTVAMATLPPASKIEQIAEEMEMERRRKLAEERKKQQEEAARKQAQRQREKQLQQQEQESAQARETLHMIQEQRDYLLMAMKKAKQSGQKDEVKALRAQLKDVETFEAELQAKASLA